MAVTCSFCCCCRNFVAVVCCTLFFFSVLLVFFLPSFATFLVVLLILCRVLLQVTRGHRACGKSHHSHSATPYTGQTATRTDQTNAFFTRRAKSMANWRRGAKSWLAKANTTRHFGFRFVSIPTSKAFLCRHNEAINLRDWVTRWALAISICCCVKTHGKASSASC